MRKILSLVFFVTTVSNAQRSDQATISILTCGPYQGEIYSAFGHSAFRIRDPLSHLDVVCNYGTYNFDQPNFYLNFAKGYLYFQFSIEDYQRFENRYVYENRFIHEQVLNLTQQQKEKLFEYLKWNSLPENQYYVYNYFYNNCSTKIRDVILQVLGDDISFDQSYITTGFTFRELTDIYLNHQPWGDLGIDIGLGLPTDKKAAPLEYMFLPDYLEMGFDHATIIKDESRVALVKEKRITHEARKEEIPVGLPHPMYVFGLLLLLALALTYWDFKRKKISSWFDVILFTTAGLTGLLLLCLWVFTDHRAAAKNFNLLWAAPTHLIAVISLGKSRKWIVKYFLYTSILTLIVLLSWTLLPQKLHYALIPFVATVAIRSFAQFYWRKQKITLLSSSSKMHRILF